MRKGTAGGRSDRSAWWKERVVSRGSTHTRSSAQRPPRPDRLSCFLKLLQVRGRESHRSTLKKKKEKKKANCQWRKREKVKRSELDLFSKCSHILGSTVACPCQKRVGRGGMKSGRVRKSTLCFPPLVLLPEYELICKQYV